MPTSINNNFLANNAANNLKGHYARLAASTQRLSSGLRVNSAADDAAGLAIRELQRADIAALNQGARNANDAISLIQVADGALAIIDEKLIRMKELAEQAATGTYNSTQRQMIDSEFRAMADEIDRIARATEFNGIHLLDGSLSGPHNGNALKAGGKMKIHFGTANDSAEDYYYVDIGDCTTKGLGLHDPIPGGGKINIPGAQWLANDARIDWDANKLYVDVGRRSAGASTQSPQSIPGMPGFDYYRLPVGLVNIVATSSSAGSFIHKPHMCLFTRDGTQITGVRPDKDWEYSNQSGFTPTGRIWWSLDGVNYPNTSDYADDAMGKLIAGGALDAGAVYNGDGIIYKTGESTTVNGATIEILQGMDEDAANHDEVIKIDKITSDLVFTIGGHDSSGCRNYKLQIEAEITPELKKQLMGHVDENSPTQITDITTQNKAQEALVRINDAIVSKDTIRAHLGALQNRLENTMTNLTIQSENLQAAESRISDLDVAQEMAAFVRNQVLTQSAVAMLAQANSSPQMLAQLING